MYISNLQSDLKINMPLGIQLSNCLNQLRDAQISFLNLGNIIFCPNKQCLLIFQHKHLIQIQFIQPRY